MDYVLIVIYQSLPLIYVYLLCQAREKLNPKAPSVKQALALRDGDESIHHLKFLVADYTPSKWWFEVLDLYRRIIFLGVIPLLGDDGAARAYAGCTLALVSTVYMREVLPFRHQFTNVLAVIAQYVILMAFMAALLICTDSLAKFNLTDFAVGCIMTVANSTLVLIAVGIGWARYRKEKHEMQAALLAKVIKIEWATGFSANKVDPPPPSPTRLPAHTVARGVS